MFAFFLSFIVFFSLLQCENATHPPTNSQPSLRLSPLSQDIVDTGVTMNRLIAHLLDTHQARSVKVAVLLDKKARRTVEVPVDFVGFECPDEFVIGYGLDFNAKYRGLPYIGVLKEECYQ